MRHGTELAFACVALLFGQFARADKKPFTIADQYRVVGVSDPRPSRDGSRIVYVATHTGLAKAKKWSEIRMVNADGTGDRELTQGQHLDTAPRWSPDGASLAFVSDRSGDETQLFLLPLGGGEPRQLTTFPMGAADPVWSPDGRFIAFSSELYPECGADAACNEKIKKAWSDGPLKAHMADALLYRHWTSWRDGTYTHVLLLKVAGGSLTDLTPGQFDAPPFSLGGDVGYAFAPGSREVAIVSNHDAVPARSTNADIWLVPIDENGRPGNAANITADNPAWDGSPAYSPDGRFIAYRTQKVPGYESDLFRVALYDRATKKSKVLTESFRDWVTAVQWLPDSSGLVFQAEVEGNTPLYQLDVASGKERRLFTDVAIDAWRLVAGGVVYVRRSVGEPTEVYARKLDGSGGARLTHANDALLAEVDVRPAETMWVNAPGGRRVEVFLVKPHGFDPARRYPLILNVHGGPQDQWRDSYRGDWQVYPGAGYIVAFPNPTGSNGYGQAFVDGIARDWGGKVYEDVMAVADALAKLPYVDAARMGTMGWSYGGYFMMWLEGHSDRFKAIASMMGVYDLRAMHSATEELWFPEHDLGGEPWDSADYRTWSPSEFVKSFKTPCLVITGERDFRVPYTQSLQFFTDLQEMKVPSRLVVLSKAGHWPSWYEMAFYYDLHLDWFHRYLGGGAAPWDPEKFLRNEVFEKTP
ncbi:MAG: S9 family peptidase [Thermoanaerobaculaceae bacterium]|jgi:dipeptidyl aminopeptidase/acylaminoacyl peptidase